MPGGLSGSGGESCQAQSHSGTSGLSALIQLRYLSRNYSSCLASTNPESARLAYRNVIFKTGSRNRGSPKRFNRANINNQVISHLSFHPSGFVWNACTHPTPLPQAQTWRIVSSFLTGSRLNEAMVNPPDAPTGVQIPFPAGSSLAHSNISFVAVLTATNKLPSVSGVDSYRLVWFLISQDSRYLPDAGAEEQGLCPLACSVVLRLICLDVVKHRVGLPPEPVLSHEVGKTMDAVANPDTLFASDTNMSAMTLGPLVGLRGYTYSSFSQLKVWLAYKILFSQSIAKLTVSSIGLPKMFTQLLQSKADLS